MDQVCCGTCKYHHPSYETGPDGKREWVCTNSDADEFGLETGYKDGAQCDSWTER